MAKYKIEHDRPGCIGCAACTHACSENWEMADDGKSKCKKTSISKEELDCNMKAAKGCPVNVIHILDENGKKLI